MAKPPRDDSDDPPSLKTGCKKLQSLQNKGDCELLNRLLNCYHAAVQRTRLHPNIFSTALCCLVF
ncbi:hypothetical protein [Nostoc sp. UIC 10630]|uniref:hypothetical protein n=1 Tax=Nostoc sp. UIC 10630 TaxID=2100146 RepID=UPI0013D4F3E4|nr:hypothetical protein [Nostoc sp. UIC 10630]NEU83758.1 hypothetical protein [Nostoc sp. UIC 10630]